VQSLYYCEIYPFRIVIVNIDVVAALNTSDEPLTLSQCFIGTKTRPLVAPRSRPAVSATLLQCSTGTEVPPPLLPRRRPAVPPHPLTKPPTPSAQLKATENAGRGSGAAAVSSRDVGMSFGLFVCLFTQTWVCLSVCLFVCSHKLNHINKKLSCYTEN